MRKASLEITLKNKAKLAKDLNLFGKNIKTVIHQMLDTTFEDMVNYAKTNAIWTDRSGNARRSIAKEDLSEGDTVLFYLTIGVDYGIWLEVANDGKYKILQPTMTIYEPKIMALFESIGIELSKQGVFTKQVMRQG